MFPRFGYAGCPIRSKLQNEPLVSALVAAREAYEGVKLANSRSDEAAQDYVARSAVLLREARRDRPAFNSKCKADGIKVGGKRVETLAIRLGSADPGLRRPDWANATAEIVDQLADDLTVEAAKKMIRDTSGGIRGLSDLRTGRATEGKAAKKPVSLLEWSDAELCDIPADLEVSLPQSGGSPRVDHPDAYVLAIAKVCGADFGVNVWLCEEAEEAGLRRLITKIKRRPIGESGPVTYIERYLCEQRAKHTKLDDDQQPTGPEAPASAAAVTAEEERETEPAHTAMPQSPSPEPLNKDRSIAPPVISQQPALKARAIGYQDQEGDVPATRQTDDRSGHQKTLPRDCPLRGAPRGGCPTVNQCKRENECFEAKSEKKAAQKAA